MLTGNTPFFTPKLRLYVVIFLFLVAFIIRFYHINQLSLNFHVLRQHHSAIIARGYYFETLTTIPEWRREIALINKQGMAMLEPRIIERLASLGYQLVGWEDLRIPQLLSSIFWLIGGLFLYLLACKITSQDAALVSVAFYLFLPFAVTASMSFQPDPLMIMMTLASIYIILLYYKQPSGVKLGLAATLSAFAMFVKPVCVFLIFGVFIALALYKYGLRDTFRNRNVWLFGVGSLLLPVTYYFVYGVLIVGFVQGQAQVNLLGFLFQSFFWKNWFTLIWRAVGYVAIIGSLFGMLLIRSGLPRTFLLGLWGGYFVYGLVFNFKISTHDYYQLPIIPIIALSLGPVGALMIHSVSQTCTLRYCRIIIIEILLLALLLGIYQVRLRILAPDLKLQEIQDAQEIGEIVNHSKNTIFLASQSGKLLLYYGEIAGYNWPHHVDYVVSGREEPSAASIKQQIRSLIANNNAEYFIVTEFPEYESQPDLMNFLTENFPVVVHNNDYLIFDLRSK